MSECLCYSSQALYMCQSTDFERHHNPEENIPELEHSELIRQKESKDRKKCMHTHVCDVPFIKLS